MAIDASLMGEGAEFEIIWLNRLFLMVGNFAMTFFALNFNVFAGQRKAGPVMVKFFRRFPVILGMAAFAGGFAELSAMFVGMAISAFCSQPQKCPLRILSGGPDQVQMNDVPGGMAFPAFQIFMFAFKGVSGILMSKLLLTALPIDQLKVPSLVFDMAVFTLPVVR